jgi:hypothetical protein
LYPAVPGAGDGFAGNGLMMVAVRLEDVVSPLRNGRPIGGGGVTAEPGGQVVAGSGPLVRAADPGPGRVFLRQAETPGINPHNAP